LALCNKTSHFGLCKYIFVGFKFCSESNRTDFKPTNYNDHVNSVTEVSQHGNLTFITAIQHWLLGSLVVRVFRWSRVQIPPAVASTGMGECLQVGKPPQYFNKPPGPTQPPTLSGMGNEYQSKCGDTQWLWSKGRYGSFHLWINVWVAGKTVWSLVNTCHTWAP